MSKSNGEFKGRTEANLTNLREDIRDLKSDVKALSTKIDRIENNFITLKTRAATYGAVGGVILGIITTVALKIFF